MFGSFRSILDVAALLHFLSCMLSFKDIKNDVLFSLGQLYNLLHMSLLSFLRKPEAASVFTL